MRVNRWTYVSTMCVCVFTWRLKRGRAKKKSKENNYKWIMIFIIYASSFSFSHLVHFLWSTSTIRLAVSSLWCSVVCAMCFFHCCFISTCSQKWSLRFFFIYFLQNEDERGKCLKKSPYYTEQIVFFSESVISYLLHAARENQPGTQSYTIISS